MTVDLFLIEASRVVPVEFQAWQVARDYWSACANRALSCEDWSGAEGESLNRLAIAAKGEADRLERIARAAFRRAV